MMIVGRLTKDAAVSILKDERKVMNFTVAVNDSYKPKGAEKSVSITTYFNCSYWVNMQLAERLSKGALVELNGRIGINAYKDMQGEAKASLVFHVNTVKIHQTGKKESIPAVVPKEEHTVADDLPF